MKVKEKLCACGCGKIGKIWSKGMLQACYFRAYRKKAIKKVSKKQEIKLEAKKELLKEDFALYNEIWHERAGICAETGDKVPNSHWCQHHVMIKSIWPQYRHCKWNILTLSINSHQQAELDVTKMDYTYNYTRFLRDNHNEIFESCGENDLNKEWKAKYNELWNKN